MATRVQAHSVAKRTNRGGAGMTPWARLRTVSRMNSGIIAAPPRLVRFASEWAWTLVAITYVAVAASVFFRFFSTFTGL